MLKDGYVNVLGAYLPVEIDPYLDKDGNEGERTPAYRGESFLLQREQHCSSEELLRLTLSPQA